MLDDKVTKLCPPLVELSRLSTRARKLPEGDEIEAVEPLEMGVVGLDKLSVVVMLAGGCSWTRLPFLMPDFTLLSLEADCLLLSVCDSLVPIIAELSDC